MESWHTAHTKEADNNSKPLPKQYSILLDKRIYPFYRFYNFFILPFCIYSIYILVLKGFSLEAEACVLNLS